MLAQPVPLWQPHGANDAARRGVECRPQPTARVCVANYAGIYAHIIECLAASAL